MCQILRKCKQILRDEGLHFRAQRAVVRVKRIFQIRWWYFQAGTGQQVVSRNAAFFQGKKPPVELV